MHCRHATAGSTAHKMVSCEPYRLQMFIQCNSLHHKRTETGCNGSSRNNCSTSWRGGRVGHTFSLKKRDACIRSMSTTIDNRITPLHAYMVENIFRYTSKSYNVTHCCSLGHAKHDSTKYFTTACPLDIVQVDIY